MRGRGMPILSSPERSPKTTIIRIRGKRRNLSLIPANFWKEEFILSSLNLKFL